MFAVIFCTTPTGEAEKITRPLIDEKLVACVNIVAVDSFFRWKGKLETEKESLLIMKTRTDRTAQVIKRVKAIHPYDIPEIIALPIIDGIEEYLQWVEDSLSMPD